MNKTLNSIIFFNQRKNFLNFGTQKKNKQRRNYIKLQITLIRVGNA